MLWLLVEQKGVRTPTVSNDCMSFYNNVKVLLYEMTTKVLCLLERAKFQPSLHCWYRPYPSGIKLCRYLCFSA